MGERARIGMFVLVGLATTLAACKPHGSRAPRRDVSGMTVDQIERELALNGEELQAAGVWVPEPAPASTPPAEAPPADAEAGIEPDAGEPEAEAEEPALVDATDMPAPGKAAQYESGGVRRRGIDRGARRDAASRCDRICDLAAVTCDLQDQICSLTARHAHEVRYQAACARAGLQCQASERECELCSE